jgi:transposase
VHTKSPELRPNDWILRHGNAPAHKILCVKQFLAPKSINETEHKPCSPDLAPNDLRLFTKIKSALKGRRFHDIYVKKVTTVLRAVRQQVFNSGSIVGLSAQLLKGSTSKVTPLSKL